MYSNIIDETTQENIPLRFRTIQGIVYFIFSLFPTTSPYRVETVTLPRHYQDQAGDSPRCKGFALVTLSHMSDVELLLKAWPWERHSTPKQRDLEGEKSEAAKYGFRTLSKRRWDQLQEEYLTYKQRLLEEIDNVPPKGPSDLPILQGHGSGDVPPLDMSVAYPPGCLIFVKNVHPETNKTTLRTLFSAAFKDLDGADKEGLDYVDFTKGLDSVSSPPTPPLIPHSLLLFFVFQNSATSV